MLDLVEATWVEPATFSLELTRPERIDYATDVGEARQLVDSDETIASATGIDASVIGASGSLDSMAFWWKGTSASVTVAGRDRLIAVALRNSAAAALEPGALEPDPIAEPGLGAVEPDPIAEPGRTDVQTQFRPTRQWPRWQPDRDVLRAFLALIETTWADPSTFRLHLTRPERTDTAGDVEAARRLLDADEALSSATGIDVSVIGPSGSIDSMAFWWQGNSASVTVAGRDGSIADALRNRAAEILERGGVDPEEPTPLAPYQRLVERETKLDLAGVRFAGTYASVHRLVDGLAAQVRQVRGSLDYVYVVLTEPGTTLTVRHLGQLGEITSRDVDRLRHLTISLGSSADGPALSVYIIRPRNGIVVGMIGNVSGPDEAPVRALRAAADDLLRDRGSFPVWILWIVTGLALVLEGIGTALQFVDHLQPFGWALVGTGVVASMHWLYLPRVELLGDGAKTRWSRWSRYIVGLVVAWVIGSMTVPLFIH